MSEQLFVPFLIALAVVCGCQPASPVTPLNVETFQLSPEENARQIKLIGELNAAGFDSLVGKKKSDATELLSLANEIVTRNGIPISYHFHRTGAGGNDDGSDTQLILVFDNDTIAEYKYPVMLD